ncbi:MAG TPA: hypothetical protein VFT22_35720 [Kofleriaceae bacterium]|nr:hypothetical protein [Kofleriaceae bacterium]
MNLPRVLLLALALLQAGGILDLVRRSTCEEECRRNGCAGDCTPDHDAPQCSCHCPSGATVAPAAVQVAASRPAAPASEIAFDATDQLGPSPDPREILHVPRQHAVGLRSSLTS